MQKTIYSPGTTDPNGAGKDSLPESQKTSMKVSTWDRDWYEIVMEPRIFHINNWGSDTPIIWAQNRIHLEKAWLVSASEFVNTDPHSENRKYETTSGDGLTDGDHLIQITKLILDVHLLQINIKEMIYINLQMITTK